MALHRFLGPFKVLSVVGLASAAIAVSCGIGRAESVDTGSENKEAKIVRKVVTAKEWPEMGA